jgi:hypothetical protein
MARIVGIFVILGAAVVAALCSAPVRAAENRATLRLINPEIFVKGTRIKHIVATLDGRDFGDCWGDRRQPSNVCIKAQPIAPGPHVLELVLDPIATTYFRSVDKFNAGMSGEWTLDLKSLAVDGAKTSDYLTLFQGRQPIEGCRAALERLASMSSCTIDEFGALGPAFAEALGQCSKEIPEADQDAIVAALPAVIDNHFSLEITRCYPRAEIAKLPARLTDFSQLDDRWPLHSGAWRWAREADLDLSEGGGLAGVLEKLQAPLPAMAKRLAVVDGVITAYLGGNGAVSRQAAMSGHWSLDAETPEGQRNWLLLSDARHFYSDDYADFVAAKVTADATLDCARTEGEAETLVEFFIEKGYLRAPALKALLAMASRVPGDLGFGACSKAVDLSLESAVATADRLRPFFALDCAEARAPTQRGRSLEAFLERDPRRDNDIQQQMRQEFAQCLAATSSKR